MELFAVSNKRKRGVHSTHRAAGQGTLKERILHSLWPSMGGRAWARYILLKLRRSAADPHRVALGMAVGMWANFLPVPGLGSGLAIALAWLLRANMMAAFVGQMLGNAWTMPLIWWLSYKVGLLVFPIDPTAVGFAHLMANFHTEYVLENWRVLAKSVLLPLAAGGQMLGLPLAVLSYFGTRWEVRRFWQHRRMKNELKLQGK